VSARAAISYLKLLAGLKNSVNVKSGERRSGSCRTAFESADMSAHSNDPLKSAELDAALSNCLSCKGCTPECPSNVNLALLKAEMLYARHRRDGLPLRERIFSSVDLLGRIGCTMPRLANSILDFAPARRLMERALGISAKRSLPHYASERFDRWFAKHAVAALYESRTNNATVTDRRYRRGKVILWDDTFVRYHEPHIGIAAVRVLEALGFEVELLQDRECCGRPAFSQGNLDLAAKLGRHNVDLLNCFSDQTSNIKHQPSAAPILFLEPSCWSMFVDDYRELKIDNAEKIGARCFLFEKFVDDLLAREPNALQFEERSASAGGLRRDRQVNVAIHPHCHVKSLTNPAFMARLVERLPGRKAKLLDTGCCGMAGAFGALAEKYDLSVKVAADLLNKIGLQPVGTEIIASGTSCRHQIVDLRRAQPKHMAELIAEALV
jgi:Fe-S oxidoreductase